MLSEPSQSLVPFRSGDPLVCLWLGSGDVARTDLSGNISYNGEPIPFGRIQFIPDAAQGSAGGPGYAQIVDGRYDTGEELGRGLIGGPHKIIVTGYSRKPELDGSDEVAATNHPPVEKLFVEYRLGESVQGDQETLDIVVPSAAAETLIVANPKKPQRRRLR